MLNAARTFLCTLLLATAASAASAQAKPDSSGLEFSGLWKQANDRCQPPRKGDVRLRIEDRNPALTVETSIASDSGTVRHAVQRYSTDGKPTVTTGADGDEFHTSVVWKDGSLVFTIEEHEDGRILRSKETWTLIENGGALQRVREPLDKGAKQTLIYVRQQPPRGLADRIAANGRLSTGPANSFPLRPRQHQRLAENQPRRPARGFAVFGMIRFRGDNS